MNKHLKDCKFLQGSIVFLVASNSIVLPGDCIRKNTLQTCNLMVDGQSHSGSCIQTRLPIETMKFSLSCLPTSYNKSVLCVLLDELYLCG